MRPADRSSPWGELSRWPLVVAPMAGGPSTVDLVVAGARAGALAFLAGGYKTAGGLAEDMAGVRSVGVETFGVNLFVPGEATADPAGLATYLAQLEPTAGALGVTVGDAAWNDDEYPGKVQTLLSAPPAVVSFTFGIPSVGIVRALQAAGSLVLLTVTTPEEAVEALRAEPDALVLQGAEAGAHRGSLANDDRPDEDRPVRALLAAVRRRTRVPLIAAGGVGGPEDVADLLARGRTWCRPAPRSSAAPRAARRSCRRTPWARVRSHAPRSPAPSAAAGRVRSSTPWWRTTRARRPPTPRSTTRPGRCAPRPSVPATPST